MNHKLEEIAIRYGSKSCLLSDLVEYHKDAKQRKDLNQIPVVVYFKKELDEIKIDDDQLTIDSIMEYLSQDYSKALILLIYVIQKLNLKDISIDLFESINSNIFSEDEIHQNMLEFLSQLKF